MTSSLWLLPKSLEMDKTSFLNRPKISLPNHSSLQSSLEQAISNDDTKFTVNPKNKCQHETALKKIKNSDLNTVQSNDLMNRFGNPNQLPNSKPSASPESVFGATLAVSSNYAQTPSAKSWIDSLSSTNSEMEKTGILEWSTIRSSPNVLPAVDNAGGSFFTTSSQGNNNKSHNLNAGTMEGNFYQSGDVPAPYTSFPQWDSFSKPSTTGLESNGGAASLGSWQQDCTKYKNWEQSWRTNLDEQVDGGYVGDISSRESSQDRQDYDEALADDEDEEALPSLKQVARPPILPLSNPSSSFNNLVNPDNLFDKIICDDNVHVESISQEDLAYENIMHPIISEKMHLTTNNRYPMLSLEVGHPQQQSLLSQASSFPSCASFPTLSNQPSPSDANSTHSSIQTLPKFTDELGKNIWSDYNANSLTNPKLGIPSISGASDTSGGEDENKVCKVFENLKLKSIWQDDQSVEKDSQKESVDAFNAAGCNVSKQAPFDATWTNNGISVFSDEPPNYQIVNPTSMRPEASSEAYPAAPFLLSRTTFGEMVNADCSQLDIQMGGTCGPSGVQAVLQHDHHSNFSSIVPGRANVGGPDMLKPSTSDEAMPKKENLLTSPRTHFRPITQQDSLREESSPANGEVNNTPTDSSPLNLNYQRSNSGSLYLEKDIITGSPKKYMVYKNPLDDNILDHRPLYMANQETSLVPKFEVIKNEKFCQTEEVEETVEIQQNVASLRTDKDYDVVFSQNNPLDANLARWGNEDQNTKLISNLYDPCNSNNFDDDGTNATKDILESIESFRFGKLPTAGQFLMRTDGDHAYCDRDTSSPQQVQDRVLDTPAANAIWSSDPNMNVPVTSQQYSKAIIQGGLNSAIKALWANSPQEKEDLYQLDRSSSVSSAGSAPGWSMVIANNNEEEIRKQIPKEWINEGSINYAGTQDHISGEESRVLAESSIIKIPENLSRCYPREGVWSSGDDVITSGEEIVEKRCRELAFSDKWSQQNLWALQQEQGFNGSNISSDLAELLEAQRWEEMVSMGEEAGNDEQEDLEELNPGWIFEDCFVWDPQQEIARNNMPQADMRNEEDDSKSISSNSSEVLRVPTDNGGTLEVPVEYFDNDTFDHIFGSPDAAVSSSLPEFGCAQEGLRAVKDQLLPAWKRPCTFFMEGSCRRKHCKFSHDLSSITCRFWREGSCLKGTECPFLHGFSVTSTRRRNKSEGDPRAASEGRAGDGGAGTSSFYKHSRGSSSSTKYRHRHSSFELASEADFPSLGGSSSDITKVPMLES